jgi:general secretion pathway protein E
MEAKFTSGAVSLINDLLEKAVSLDASDIHIEPNSSNVRVRYRIDGLLRSGIHVHRSMHSAVISRIKILAELDISEQRVPQDGRAFIKISNREFDLRISIVPTLHGEKAVIRLLDRGKTALPLEELGMAVNDLDEYKKEIKKPQGMIIVCGPTGCGKTTTLYSSLGKINNDSLNIITIEDPIEYQLGGINQMQVNQKTGLTFAKGLRGILRQDPDVIMVGEIRDHETASIAIQAAMTGHLVFATLHTNDAASAPTRLKDMGVETFLIADTLNCVVSQRLVRKVCASCKGLGCKICTHTGFKGRIGVFELLMPRSRSARSRTIIENAEILIKNGITTKEEVLNNIYIG